MNLFVFISCTLLSLKLFFVSSEDAPAITTKVGTIMGTVKETDVFGKSMRTYHYFGIPYAEAPVGDLRFKKPIPKTRLVSPFDASKHGKTCLQVLVFPFPEEKHISIDEDCLTLNVYVPVGSEGSQGNLAVMVNIYGGGFICGASEPYVSDTLSAYGNVIVVTFNYRLSVWGFLSTSDEHAPGNYGLWDQHLAIKWVHDNIEAFGGDPGRVTILGESAGASSVVYQSLFEGNKGLFQRAIAQSGSITNPWASSKTPRDDAELLGKLVGCAYTESGPLIDCLRNISPDILNATLNDFSNGLLRLEMPFTPTVDGEFVKEPAKKILYGHSDVSARDREVFASIDFLSGICAEEGVVMLDPELGVEDTENFEPNRTFLNETLLPLVFPYAVGTEIPEIVTNILTHAYTDWEEPENMEKRRNKIVALLSDISFGVSLAETVAWHHSLAPDSKNTFMYIFDIPPSIRHLPTPSWAKKANHGDDLIYTYFEESEGMDSFTLREEVFKPTDTDRDAAKYMMDMWSNFAKTG